ncbi:hypothetical protein ABET52_09900 [Saccharococcus caldoxylosilyticus]|uniref:hypothetical protein n=1 Tax=Saccharococcus caldoxylosilyticus TaxID=81408 RepID=UPI001C4E0ABE|nr:hypothetical protein [Parageobacillus caldoxylosilyticus]QXJ37474.1 hypothetical protein BV455_00736 [Parageobacillus caldoxylosilyticus]
MLPYEQEHMHPWRQNRSAANRPNATVSMTKETIFAVNLLGEGLFLQKKIEKRQCREKETSMNV